MTRPGLPPLPEGSEVTICIPAWQAEPFIERTLDHALDQTHRRIRVLVSVDRGDDATADLCRARATRDGRVEVLEQPERLGWAANVNALLDRVETPSCFLYPHDDVILPRYVERLLGALRSRPGAVSVHCDMGHFGGSDRTDPAVEYTGAVEARLATFLIAPRRGSPLRSLIRREVLDDGLRMPTDAVGGLWANDPFLFELVAAGPALAVPETLYHRWDDRAGGLTDGWKRLTLEQLRSGFARNAATLVRAIERALPEEPARERLRYCVYLSLMTRVRMLEREREAAPMAPEQLHPAFAQIAPPPSLEALGSEAAGWAATRQERLDRLDRELRRPDRAAR